MAEKLTPQQALAVSNRGGKLLVSAAAGSGKTKVLVDRLMSYLLDSQEPANLDDFLIITYTKAAASELRGKIAQKLTERIAQDPENTHLQRQLQRLFLTKISTVHGFCADVLREYAYRLDIAADFRVADENECAELRIQVLDEILNEAYAASNKNADFESFVNTQGLGRDDRLVPELIQKVYDSAMCHLDPEGWLNDCIKSSEVASVSDVSETVWGKFLIDDLYRYLDRQIAVMNRCTDLLNRTDGLEKQAANFEATLTQLRELRNCSSWDAIVDHKNIDYGRLVFPRKNPDQTLTDQVKAIRTACKKGLDKKLQSFSDPSAQVLHDLQQSASGTRGLVDLVRVFSERFRKAKHARRVLDFADLEHRMLDLLLGRSRSGITSAAIDIGNRFREIMVDEYQDSNGVQDAIFNALTSQRQNLFLVGDVKQSIYQFRLADPGIFLEKYAKFAPAQNAEEGMGRKILLSHNFRSGAEVIEAVNEVFTRCMSPEVGGLYYTDEEALREGIPHIPLSEPAVELYALDVREETYREESQFVAEQIERMLREGTLIRKADELVPVTADDIVILLRSPGSVGIHFQRALEAKGIRCNTGGGQDLLQTEEIGTLRSLLQVIVNPRQDIPLISTLASPLFGFTADDLAAFRSAMKKGSVYDALLNWNDPKAAHFLNTLRRLREEASLKPLSELMKLVYTHTGLERIYSSMDDGDTKVANLQTFYQLAADFEMGNARDLLQFLEHLEAVEGKGLLVTSAGQGGAVTLMSIHKSKGLEFPVVFLCGLAREFNTENLRAQILCDQQLGLGLSVVDNEKRIRYPSVAKRAISLKIASSGLSEELRVLYVAMTRARDRLIMTYAPRNLESALQDIALRKDMDDGMLLSMEASCPGDWVMLAAMGLTEAGALFAIGGNPQQTHTGNFPWKIRVDSAPDQISAASLSEIKKSIPEGAKERIAAALQFSYPHTAATKAPSKQTATGLKGRDKDEEAAKDTTQQKKQAIMWRKPSFASAAISGKAYGNAVHHAMQYLRFEHCGSMEGIEQEISRMVDAGLLNAEQAEMIDCDKIATFFKTEIGKMLCEGVSCIREFKFSILDDGKRYDEKLHGEKVLLQGVVDCAIIEYDGITILDFKTDYITEDTIPVIINRYELQLKTYADALTRIFEMPVKSCLLYLFHLNRFIEIP